MTDRVRLLLPAAFVAAAGALLAVLAVTARLGPLVALSGTEVNYAQAAVQLSQGHGYVDCPGLPIPWFPPGYAASLAVLIRAGLSVADATRWVGATAAAVLAFSIAWLAGRRLGGAVAVLTAWLVTLNPIMLRWEMELIADASHAAAVMAALALTLAYLRHRRRGWLVAAGAAAAAAAMLRFIGVAVDPSICLVLLILGPRPSWRGRIADCVIFGVTAVAPLLLFTAYNRAVSGTAGGERPLIVTSPWYHLRFIFDDMSRWAANLFGPAVRDLLPVDARVALFLAILVAALAGLSWLARRADAHVRQCVWLCLLFVATYVLGLTGLASLIPLDDLGGRFLLPTLGPLAVAVVTGGGVAAESLGIGAGSVRRGMAVLLVAVSVVPAVALAGLAEGRRTFAFNKAAAPEVSASDFVAELKRAAAAGPLTAADVDSRHFVLLHLGRCVPVAPADTSATIVTVDTASLDYGRRLRETGPFFMGLAPNAWLSPPVIGKLVRK